MLTVQAGMVAIACLFVLGFLLLLNLHSFFAVNAPVEADVLVVDGWLPDHALERAVVEFHRGSYQKIVTLGPPLIHGRYLLEYKTYAEMAAATLMALGIQPEELVVLPLPTVDLNRTFTAALGLNHWLSTEKAVHAVNLFTLGTHARRSWLLYRWALPDTTQIGIIAAEPDHYDPQRWWRSSAGVQSVIAEVVGYTYVCLARFYGTQSAAFRP